MPRLDRPKRPKGLINAIGAMYTQAVLNVVAGVLLLYAAGLDADHGRDVSEMTYVVAYLSLGIAAVLVACAVLVTLGYSWARFPATLIEVLNIIGGFITLASGGGTALPTILIGLLLCVIVLVGLFGSATNEWFDLREEAKMLGPVKE